MAFADWLLSRSEAFRLLMMKVRDHKQDTIDAFSKVKKKHVEHERRLDEHADRIRQMEEVMSLLHEKVQADSKPRIVIKDSGNSAIIKRARKVK